MANWSKETQEKMIQRVREIWAIKSQGARVSNHAAAMDYRKTVDRVQQEVCPAGSLWSLPDIILIQSSS